MALVPLINNITQEQLGQGVPSWFIKFLGPFNDFLTKVKYALSGNLAYTNNIACQIVKLNFQTDANYISKQTFQNLSFQSTLSTSAFGCSIQQITRTSGGTGFDNVTAPIWNQNGSTINITWIGGLQNSSSYTITLLLK
jgi:hypothetical protein